MGTDEKGKIKITCQDCHGRGVSYHRFVVEHTDGKVLVCHVCGGNGFQRKHIDVFSGRLDVVPHVSTVILGDGTEIPYEEFLKRHNTPIV